MLFRKHDSPPLRPAPVCFCWLLESSCEEWRERRKRERENFFLFFLREREKGVGICGQKARGEKGNRLVAFRDLVIFILTAH